MRDDLTSNDRVAFHDMPFMTNPIAIYLFPDAEVMDFAGSGAGSRKSRVSPELGFRQPSTGGRGQDRDLGGYIGWYRHEPAFG